jgi:hypothetical protein
MKVYIKSSDLTAKEPHVVARYSDDTEVPPDAHPGTIMLTLPNHLIVGRGTPQTPMVTLAPNWRDVAGKDVMRGEAERRAESAFPLAQRVAVLNYLLRDVLTHGTDVTKWPSDAQHRLAESQRLWRYVSELETRAARAPAELNVNPALDSNWPTLAAAPQ